MVGVMLDRACTGDKRAQPGEPSDPRDGVPHIAAFMRATIATNLTGKSLRIIRNCVKPGNQKYSASVLTQISRITPLVSPQMRALAIVTNVR